MMKNLSIILIILTGFLHAQFAEVTVQTEVQRLNDRERQELQGLEDAISQFFTSSPWEDEVADLEMFLDIQFVFQSTISIGNETYYQAQVVLSNRQDQRFFIKDANFPYSPGRSVNLTPAFDPLASLLEFYAYLLIAGELDTYELLAGSPYYTKAKSLATLGENDPHVNRGWTDRIRLAERLAANQDLRRAKTHFYQALDMLAEEEPALDELRAALSQFYKSINAVVTREGQDRHMSVFLSGHAEEVAEMMALAGMWNELAEMMILNPDSERIYRSYLEGGSSK
ncbi:MAG: DUF4835 family protein [Fidelibacterota bacterium]|nr:MAG: DUF4835 family protein [Candidatus Neomarinimicrobiota bacterium]